MSRIVFCENCKNGIECKGILCGGLNVFLKEEVSCGQIFLEGVQIIH